MIAKDESPLSSSIPVIDLSTWNDTNASAKERAKTATDLVNACKEVGFVYIINHGISEELLSEAFAISKKLFDLSHEEKMLAPHPPNPNWHRGYSYPGLEKVSQVNGGGEDSNKVEEQLREVKDCKVSLLLLLCSNRIFNAYWAGVHTSKELETIQESGTR